MDLLEWSRHFRCFPGRGELPLEPFAEQVTRCGYRGPRSLEIFNDGFRASPNGATAKDGYRSLLWLEEQTRRRLRRAMPICFHRRRCRSITGWSPSSLPPAPPRRSAWGSICRRWVFSTREATAPNRVTLWRNGGARIVINHQPHSWADHFYQRHGVSLCAMALRVDRSAPIVARARALGYATWQGDAGPNETPIPAICAPDGSLIYLIEAGEGI